MPMLVILQLERLRQEELELKANLDFMTLSQQKPG